VLVNTEGDVGSVSRYTEMGGSDISEAEVGFNVAIAKGSLDIFNFGTGVDSTEILPFCERVMRTYDTVSLNIKPRYAFAEHLVGLTKILAFQGCITMTLKPIKRELGGCGPRMNLGSCDQPVHCIREEKVR